jgi:hypothetical protein
MGHWFGYDFPVVTTIEQRVTVEKGGRVALQSSELHEGESAELIVIVERAGEAITTPDERLGTLHQLRQALNLSAATAERWEADVRAERSASRIPSAD